MKSKLEKLKSGKKIVAYEISGGDGVAGGDGSGGDGDRNLRWKS